ncbi:MAG TPA: hypothetical protein VM115_00890 [Vicinamibacterales bacterium]|nr:hypothetical protein [Vicinamibacterales bacterium]
MKRLVFALFVLVVSAAPSWGAGLTLSIRDGLVTLDAQDVTVRQILTEWARIGKTRIINVERVTGGPVTLKIDAMPEKQALDLILRAIPGYMALPRETMMADASRYDRILIMATTTTVAAPRPQQPSPGFPGMQSGMPNQGGPGGTMTQLRPNVPAPFSPGILPEQSTAADQMDDPAIAAAAAAGLVPIPAVNPGATALSAPLMAPGAPVRPAPTTPGVGAPTNPFNVPVGTAQPSLAPPPTTVQAPPPTRTRPPQADR